MCRKAIFVWPWNENARTKQKQQTNGNTAIWLVYRTDTNARGFWLVKRTLGWKNFMPENFLEINRYFALTSYCNTIGQSNNAFSILGFSLACFDLFIHWLIKQITNTYRDHFSRSYENRSIDRENKNMWNRGRGGTRIGLYYSSFLVHSQKVSLFCNVISPLIPASVLYCLLSHWNYD